MKHFPSLTGIAGDQPPHGLCPLDETLLEDYAAAGTSEIIVDEVNNASMVFRIDFGEHSALFTADIYIETEKKLLTMYPDGQLDADLMKMPHHGWTSSNSSAFVTAVSPEIAVATGAHELAIKIWKPYNTAKALVLEDLHDGYIHIAADSDGTMEHETSR